MDYEKMKALMEASREQSLRNAGRKSKSFASRILSRIGNGWIPYEKNGLQLNGGTSHENPDEISVVPDSAQTPWIYLVPGRAGRTLAGELDNLG